MLSVRLATFHSTISSVSHWHWISGRISFSKNSRRRFGDPKLPAPFSAHPRGRAITPRGMNSSAPADTRKPGPSPGKTSWESERQVFLRQRAGSSPAWCAKKPSRERQAARTRLAPGTGEAVSCRACGSALPGLRIDWKRSDGRHPIRTPSDTGFAVRARACLPAGKPRPISVVRRAARNDGDATQARWSCDDVAAH